MDRSYRGDLNSSAAPFPARGRRCHLLRPPSRSCTRRGNAQAAQPFALDSGTTLHLPSMVALHRSYISAACFEARETDVAPAPRRRLPRLSIWTWIRPQRRGPLAASADVHVGPLSLLREFRRRRWVSLETSPETSHLPRSPSRPPMVFLVGRRRTDGEAFAPAAGLGFLLGSLVAAPIDGGGRGSGIHAKRCRLRAMNGRYMSLARTPLITFPPPSPSTSKIYSCL